MELKLALAASGTSRARPSRCHLPGGVEGEWVRDGDMCNVGCSVRHERGTRGWGGTVGRNKRALFEQRTKKRHVSLSRTKVPKWPLFPL